MGKKRTEVSAAAQLRHNVDKIISVATVGAPHGIHGWLKFNSTTPELLLQVDHWLLREADASDEAGQIIEPEERRNANGRVLAKLPNINTRDEAKEFVGASIGLRRGDLPSLPTGEYYWCDLLGLVVIGADGKPLGTVAKVHATPANNILELAPQDGGTLIPFTDNYVLKVDFAAGQVKTSWQADY